MAYADKIFKDNLRNVLVNGVWDTDYNVRPKWSDSSPAHTKYITHVVNTYDIAKEGLPILTIRPIAWKTGLKEIFWIYQDQSNDVDVLEEKYNVNYWREWANEFNHLGTAYGYQMAKKINFPEGTYKQLDRVIHLLKTDPMNRRITTNMLPLDEMIYMELPACCYETWWSVREGYLDMMLIQRSGDLIPAAGALNVTQYALLLTMISQITGYRVGKMTHVINNLHIYNRHLEIAEKLLNRKEYEQPILHVNSKIDDFYDFRVEDFKLENYQHGEQIKDIPIAI
ncbi:thymidylate synthase [Tissierella praeacuta]|uniref:thymidylate synthase n=1 Tax=Tissierella praeacuta TaxID=43131 RepID=UPI003DA2EB72